MGRMAERRWNPVRDADVSGGRILRCRVAFPIRSAGTDACMGELMGMGDAVIGFMFDCRVVLTKNERETTSGNTPS